MKKITLILLVIANGFLQMSFGQGWEKVNNSGVVGNSIIKSGNGYLITVVSDSGLVLKTDMFGNTLWTKTYGNDAFFTDIQNTSDGGYIVVGKVFNPSVKIFVVKTNSAGDAVWTKKFISQSTP